MRLKIVYCSMWNYEPKAVSLASRLMTAFKQQITEYALSPTGGGAFEISLNDELLYSKLKTGQFPDEEWVLGEVKKRVG